MHEVVTELSAKSTYECRYGFMNSYIAARWWPVDICRLNQLYLPAKWPSVLIVCGDGANNLSMAGIVAWHSPYRDTQTWMATRLRETEESQFDSWQRQEMFLFSIASRQVLWPTQPPIQWVPGLNDKGVTLTTNLHLQPRLRKSWAVTPIPPYAFMAYTGATYTSLPVNCVRECRVLKGKVKGLLESDVPSWYRTGAERRNVKVNGEACPLHQIRNEDKGT
jgi:hypothetical protein